jgi:hypothetical protein
VPQGAGCNTRDQRRAAATSIYKALYGCAPEPEPEAVEQQRSRSIASSISSAPWRRRSPTSSREQATSSRDQPEAPKGRGKSTTSCKRSKSPEPSSTHLRPTPKWAVKPKGKPKAVKPKGKPIYWGQGKRAFQTEAGPVIPWRKTKRGKAENRSDRSKRDRVIKGTLCRVLGSELGKAESKIKILRRKLGERLPTAKSRPGGVYSWKPAVPWDPSLPPESSDTYPPKIPLSEIP